MKNYQQELTVAQSIAREAGQYMRRYRQAMNTQYKADTTPLTEADTAINTMVIERLGAAFPEDGIVGEEESTATAGMGRRWFCDPIDGTKAYTWGVPTAMFSLGLVVDGVPVVGVAYEPFTDTLYWAVRGEGAFCNSEPLTVNTTALDEGIVAATSDLKSVYKNPEPYVQALLNADVRLATYSGAVHKSLGVASGYLCAYVFHLVNAYDMAAAHVIVEEAGGTCTTMNGEALDYTQPFRGAMVTNGVCREALLALTK